jgi:hypothetical protein
MHIRHHSATNFTIIADRVSALGEPGNMPISGNWDGLPQVILCGEKCKPTWMECSLYESQNKMRGGFAASHFIILLVEAIQTTLTADRSNHLSQVCQWAYQKRS